MELQNAILYVISVIVAITGIQVILDDPSKRPATWIKGLLLILSGSYIAIIQNSFLKQ